MKKIDLKKNNAFQKSSVMISQNFINVLKRDGSWKLYV